MRPRDCSKHFSFNFLHPIWNSNDHTVLHRDVIWFAKYLTCIILYSSNSYIIWHWFFSPCSWFHVFDCRNIQEHVFNFLTLDNCFFRFNCTIYLAKCFFINEIWNWFFLLVTESICWLYAFSFFYLIVYFILISIFTFAKKFFLFNVQYKCHIGTDTA